MKHSISALFGVAALFCTGSFAQVPQVENRSYGGFTYSVQLSAPQNLETVSLQNIPAKKLKRAASAPAQYTVFQIDGYTNGGLAGEPALPMRVEMIELPEGACAQVRITSQQYVDVDLNAGGFPYPLMPFQAPRSKSAKGAADFAYKAESYKRNGFYPQNLVEVEYQGRMRHLRLAQMTVHPVQYNALTHTLRIYTDLQFEVEFPGADPQATRAQKKILDGREFLPLQRFILNPLPGYAEAAGAQAGAKAAAKAPVHAAPPQMLVLSYPDFKQALQPYIEWKTKLGYQITELYINQDVKPHADSIRNFLKAIYDTAVAHNQTPPSYLLLVGDNGQIPAHLYNEKDRTLQNPYSDHYIAEYTGDRFPDIYYARMSAASVEELQPQIDKVLYMEQISYDATAFLNNSFLVAGVDDENHDVSYNHNFSEIYLNPTIQYINNLYIKDTLGRKAYCYLYPESEDIAEEDILAHINSGVAVGIYTGHGEWDEWSEPYVGVSGINQGLHNAGKYPFLVGNCCLSGRFEKRTCFAEALLRKQNAGAALYIGCSQESFFDEDLFWAVGLPKTAVKYGNVYTYAGSGLGANDALFHTHGEDYAQWALNGPQMIFTGNMAVESSNTDTRMKGYYWHIYHCFGDPTYMPYTQRPQNITAVHQPSVFIGEKYFSVQTVPYATVALSKGKTVYAVAVADKEGAAKIDVENITGEGTYTMGITAQNHIPLVKEITAVVPPEKYVTVESEEFDTRVGGWFMIGYTLKNIGNSAVEKTTLQLLTSDPYFEVPALEYEINSALQPGGEINLHNIYSVGISPQVPDGHIISYTLKIVMDGDADNPLLYTFHHIVKNVGYTLQEARLVDVHTGNGNGILEAGERAVAALYAVNSGSVVADTVKVYPFVVSSAVKYNPVEEPILLTEWEPGDLRRIAFNVENILKENAQHGYVLSAVLQTGKRLDTLQVELYTAAGSGQQHDSTAVENFSAAKGFLQAVKVNGTGLKVSVQSGVPARGPLCLYDINGRRVAVLNPSLLLAPGQTHTAVYALPALPRGLYLLRHTTLTAKVSL